MKIYEKTEVEKLRELLKQYEDRFGDIDNYTDRPRATNLAEVTTAVMTFSKEVRDLVRRHAFLIHYQDSVAALDVVSKREYNEAVQALTELTRGFNKVSGRPSVIDAKFTE